ncbi:HAD family hydrolase [Micromonospora sp. NPDC050397]|uniref:HAD family hydrolase n=1 Tax=Micromonospora sp. NPDC050397 TaxID=3364279 RepID=UPI00384D4F43
MRVLLLDVDGVLQFPDPGFVEAIEREHRWRHGYLAFQDALFDDPGYLRTLVGDGDFVRVADRVLADHVEGLTGAAFLRRWLTGNITLNHTLRDTVPDLGFGRVYLASNQEPLRGAHVELLHGDQRWVHGSFLSHRVGYRKPDPRYFAHILRTLGGQPAD